MSAWRRRISMAVLVSALALAGCSRDPINSPYETGALAENTLYTAFVKRSPKYLDPARSYSTDETPYTYNIYEPLYGYHYLKRPYELIPRAAAAIAPPRYYDAQGNALAPDAPGQQVAESVYDIPIRPGILFQPHPAFAREADGRYSYFPLQPGELDDKFYVPDFPKTGTRELTADDYVYAFRRLASPRVASPIYSVMAEYVLGMGDYGKRLQARDAELRRGLPPGQRDLPWLDLREGDGFEGVQALDPHTLRIRIKGKYPQFKYWLAMTFTAPIPWEADRFYSQPGMAAHDLSLNTWPVGTGPYLLAESVQNRRHVLARNPNFRGEPYPCEGEPADRAAGLLQDCGKPTPFVDRVVFSVEKEAVPLTGKFMQGYYDMPQVERGEYGVAMLVAAGDSPDKARRYRDHGIQLPTAIETSSWYMGFNWLDPVVGLGDTPEQQEKNRKLRQAISIAFNWEEYVAVFEDSQAMVAYGPVPPGVLGYREPPEGVNPVVYDLVDGKPRRKPLEVARQLLAEAGYPDGRNAETGAPLVLYYDAMTGGGSNPQFDWMRRQLAKIGIQMDVRSTDYSRFQDKMQRGTAQIFFWGWVADYPDAENFLFLLYGPNGKARHGGENAANYANPEYDRLFEQMKYLDDGPEKEAVIARMVAIVQRDAPWMFGYFPMSGGAYQQWVGNAKPTQMVRNTLQYVKVDPALRVRKVHEWNTPRWWPLLLLAAVLALAIWPSYVALKRRERQTAFGAGARPAPPKEHQP
ncbi:ABC transporter substrate-binding protein [Bordetella petrii]|uniref:Extracellular solute-binding protein n=1 Tax=Bordetella petrii (strain ATCC BAA-461 / DSM 12804 / CCUG 43448 / CIP 107267 / Se-1111R) TaxID=340100 RepID=A9HX94_BORPD|nr:ABC transporter substrate-binding protein [Bordetella petrii]CAP43734.1 putative extracellular solute-binding protein [Bordetella petrii]